MLYFWASEEEAITGGTFNYTARWSPDGKQPSIVLVHQQVHLCDYVLLLHLGNCPIRIGYHSLMFNDVFSTVIPAVSYCIILVLLVSYL